MTLHFNLWHALLITVAAFLLSMLECRLCACGLLSVIFFVFIFFFKYQKKLSFFDFVFAGACLMNFWYIVFSWGNVRQYDYFNFYMHVDYFLENDFFIRQPKNYLNNVFFQPPLWGGMEALVTRLAMCFGYAKENAFAFSRFLSFFAILGSYVVFFKFIKCFNLEQKIEKGLFLLFCFMPIHGILANLVNNDAFVYFLMLLAFYLGYLWYEQGKWKYALGVSLVLFCSGMIKFSGLMVVPALAFLGIFKFFKAKDERVQVFSQMSVVGLGAVLGFVWGFLLLYVKLPLVPPPLNNDFQSMEAFSLAERLCYLKGLFVPFVDVKAGIFEPNVWLTLVKTSLFGEWAWGGKFFGYVLYGLGIFLAFVLLWSFGFVFSHKIGQDFALNGAIIIFVFAVFLAWINFWLDYPYFCSTEFRYTAILLPLSFIWCGCRLNAKKMPEYMQYIWAGFIGLFIFARFMLYLNTI